MRASDVHEAATQHELFADLSREQIGELLAVTDGVETAADGDLLMTEGESDDSMVVVLSGTVEVVKDLIRGTEHVLAEETSVTVLGELALLLESPRVASVRARGSVRFFRLRRAEFRQLLMSGNQAALALLEKMACTLAGRLREAVESLADLLDEKVRGRRPQLDLSSLKAKYSRAALSYRL
jgi:CRP-like cAMP-binding protein